MKHSKTPLIVIIVLIIVAVAVAVLVFATRHKTNNTANNTTMNMSGANNSSGGTNTPVATNAVTVQNFAFSPSSIKVKVGDKVTWTNQDSTTHTVTADDGLFDSGDLAQGKSFSFTFTKAGTYTYHCAIHPSMTATVTVE